MDSPRAAKVLNASVAVVACGMAFYHLFTTQYFLWGIGEHMSTHLLLAMTLVFLNTLRTMKRRKLWPLVVTLMLAGIVVCSYIIARVPYLMRWTGFIPDTTALVMGIVLIIVVLEVTRQTWGLVLPAVTALAIVYFFLGHLIPGPLGHASFPFEFVLSYLGIGFQGVFRLLAVSANFIFLFVLFGGIISALGADKFFIQMGRLVGKVLAGGAGQTAVVSSALVGMTMGAAVSNVAVTGAYTIPTMKRMGYHPNTAGAIEAAASSGGQFTPPVMGGSAFLIATFIGIAYVDICIAALIPAALYFLSVALGVQVLAYKQKIPRPEEKVAIGDIFRFGPLFIVPLAVLCTLLIMRYSPMYAGFYAILVAVLIPLFRKSTRASLGDYIRGFTNGALAAAKLAVALAMIGMLVQSAITTGIGITIANLVEMLSGGHLWLALVLTMLISLFLGIGIPTLAAYAIVAIIVAPVLVRMGVPPLSAHFFVFWFAIFSTLTPPVAFASMAGAALAGGSFMKTSLEAFRLATAGFVLPYLIVFVPVLTLQSENLLGSVTILAAVPLALAALVVVLYNHFLVPTSVLERLLFALAASALFGHCFTGIYLLFVGGLLTFLVLTFWQWKRHRILKGGRG